MPHSPRVPFYDLGALHRVLAEDLEVAWQTVLDQSTFVGGPQLERFEQEWARYCGTKYAVGVSSGTDALRLTLHALGVGPGDEVIVPANTFVATVESVMAVGARPHFVDVNAETLLVTADDIEAALTARTAAVIVVHLYGQPPDMHALAGVAQNAGIALIEDAAQAHGARWSGQRVGTWGDAGCFSFYPSKNLGALGDGGAVVTDDEELAAKIRSLGDHGRRPRLPHEHEVVGGTNRLDALQAAMLSAKLPYLDAWNEARRRAAAHYEALLDGSPARLLMTASAAESVHHLQVIRVEQRDEIRRRLHEQKIQTSVHYPTPVHLLPPYASFQDRSLPVVEEAARQVISLPLFPHITDTQIEYVSQVLLDSLRREAAYV